MGVCGSKEGIGPPDTTPSGDDDDTHVSDSIERKKLANRLQKKVRKDVKGYSNVMQLVRARSTKKKNRQKTHTRTQFTVQRLQKSRGEEK